MTAFAFRLGHTKDELTQAALHYTNGCRGSRPVQVHRSSRPGSSGTRPSLSRAVPRSRGADRSL
jgi:hypothetical protein